MIIRSHLFNEVEIRYEHCIVSTKSQSRADFYQAQLVSGKAVIMRELNKTRRKLFRLVTK